jgi:SlyX protein
MNDETSARFARLESHLAHLEHQVEELNGVVIEQGKDIERLRKQVQLHARTLETSEIEQAKANNPRPPHH